MTPEIDTSRPHSARVYDHWLGGKDDYAVDRELGDQVVARFPHITVGARANRAFMRRAAAHAARQGVTQFLDVGAGIPTEPNLHQVVQEVTPDARVLYIDNDPIVQVHAAALMAGTAPGTVDCLLADAREPEAVLAHAVHFLDLSRPVGLSFMALLHFLDDDQARRLLATFTDAVPVGSTLTVSHMSYDADTDGRLRTAVEAYSSGISNHPRTRAEITALLDGWTLLDPGVTRVHRWRPDGGTEEGVTDDVMVSVYGAMARKGGWRPRGVRESAPRSTWQHP